MADVINPPSAGLSAVNTLRQDRNLAEFGPCGVVNDDCPTVREGLDRMTGVARHDCHHSCLCDLADAVDGDLECAIDHLVDLLLGMKVLVNGGTAREFVMRKRHVCRMEIASLPTWQPFNDWKTVRIHKRHGEVLFADCNNGVLGPGGRRHRM